MTKKVKVILSAPMLLEDGIFKRETISLEEAAEFAKDATNFVGHSTVKVLGIEPAETRDVCDSFDQALSLKVNGRLEFGREYSAEEILKIGVTAVLISRVE